jgi:hypothetical protein
MFTIYHRALEAVFPYFEIRTFANYLKGQCHEIFCFGFFFQESPSPKPLKITLGSFRIFRKFAEIFASQGAPPVSTTPVANFATSSACVVDTGGKFATGTTIPAANLPPESTTPEAHCHRWQIMETISGCRHLKVNLKAKIYIYVNC